MARLVGNHAATRRAGRGWLFGGIVVAVTGIMVGAAIAAIPDSSDVIHGCYAPNNGYKLRLIDTAKTSKCPAGQVGLNWNQKGVPGSPGPRGTIGPAGTNGTSIGARLRWTGDLGVLSSPTVRLGSWTQGANEVDMVIPGTMTLRLDAGCTLNSLLLRWSVPGNLDDEGNDFVYQDSPFNHGGLQGPVTVTIPLGLRSAWNPLMLFEPGQQTARSLDINLDSNETCTAGSSVRVQALSFDVAFMR